MDMTTLVVILLSNLVVAAVAGGVIYYLFQQLQKSKQHNVLTDDEAAIAADKRVRQKIAEAEKESENIVLEARSESKKIIALAKELEQEVNEREKNLLSRAKNLDQRFDELENKEKEVADQKEQVKQQRQQLSSELEKIAHMTRQDASDLLKKEVEQDLKQWTAKQVKEAEFEVKRESEDRARDILVDAMQKGASDFVAESTTTTVEITDEGIKSKIIGREGRNIRTFQRLTGVDIIVDEGPGQVTISCFDPIRREVAALALKKLLKTGVIHPTAIEETVKNIKSEVLKEIRRTGEKIAYDTGFSDLPEEIIKLLGRYKYRFSYGQNLAKHSLEMVNMGAYIAGEVGADVRMTKLACLLHDIGKVLTHDFEGKPHHHISGDIVRKYLKDEKLANAVESHHGDIEPKSIEAVLVAIADHISGARQGARRDTHEEYIKRVTTLEAIAKKYPEVEEAFALQAGREIRVIVRPESTSDEDTILLARRIAKEIEDSKATQGNVKVTAIRELRVEEVAK